MSCPRYETVDEYLDGLYDPVKAHTLKRVIEYILESFPGLAVKIAWNVPQIHRGKEYIFGMSAAKKHLSLAPWSTAVLDKFRERLSGYLVKANLFQVPVDWEVDKSLIHDMVSMRLAELD